MGLRSSSPGARRGPGIGFLFISLSTTRTVKNNNNREFTSPPYPLLPFIYFIRRAKRPNGRGIIGDTAAE